MPDPLADDAVLLRRVPPQQLARDPEAEQGVRVTSAEWDDRERDDPSVYLAAALDAEGLPPEIVLDGHDGYSLIAITAGEVREQSERQQRRGIALDVEHRPDLDDPVPARGQAHCAIVGYPPGNAERKIAREPLARRCRIVAVGDNPS